MPPLDKLSSAGPGIAQHRGVSETSRSNTATCVTVGAASAPRKRTFLPVAISGPLRARVGANGRAACEAWHANGRAACEAWHVGPSRSRSPALVAASPGSLQSLKLDCASSCISAYSLDQP